MGSHEDRSLRWQKKYFWCALWSTENIWVFIEEELGLEVPQGGHKPRGAPSELVVATWLFWPPSEASRVSFGPRKIVNKVRSF